MKYILAFLFLLSLGICDDPKLTISPDFTFDFNVMAAQLKFISLESFKKYMIELEFMDLSGTFLFDENEPKTMTFIWKDICFTTQHEHEDEKPLSELAQDAEYIGEHEILGVSQFRLSEELIVGHNHEKDVVTDIWVNPPNLYLPLHNVAKIYNPEKFLEKKWPTLDGCTIVEQDSFSLEVGKVFLLEILDLDADESNFDLVEGEAPEFLLPEDFTLELEIPLKYFPNLDLSLALSFKKLAIDLQANILNFRYRWVIDVFKGYQTMFFNKGCFVNKFDLPFPEVTPEIGEMMRQQFLQFYQMWQMFIDYGGFNEKNEIHMFFPQNTMEGFKFAFGFNANNMFSHLGYKPLNKLLPLKQPMIPMEEDQVYFEEDVDVSTCTQSTEMELQENISKLMMELVGLDEDTQMFKEEQTIEDFVSKFQY